MFFFFLQGLYSAASRFCIQNIVLYTEFFFKWFCNGSVFAQNVVIGSVYGRNNFFEYKYAFFSFLFYKRIPIVWVWGSALHKFN